MTTDRINSHWPAPSKAADADGFKPARWPNVSGRWTSYKDGAAYGDWIQVENGRTVIYRLPPVLQFSDSWELLTAQQAIPDLSNCLVNWTD